MPINEFSRSFKEVNELFDEIDKKVPPGTPTNDKIRADLAGLLVVTLAATYENIVKQILIDYADRTHPQFSFFIENQFRKLNSKINVGDLNGYADKFDPKIKPFFKKELDKAKTRLGNVDCKNKYEQILSWRHAFAHSRERKTTLEEAFEFHKHAKFVLYCYSRAFSSC